ncbi:helix-turn-helix transcriptional regulator [Nocardia sp. CA-290969]|uniref:helix-turn-helix transcriptional regulator n=1 Tax=Nocardia sp. CA-290969 TaxID=3239986 RepID=UPI003D91D898
MDLLTTPQVEREFGIPQGTLRYWRHLGIGPTSFRLGRKRIVYRRSEVDRWIAEQESATRRGDLPGSDPPLLIDCGSSTRSSGQEVPGAAASTTPTPTKEEAERVSA